MTVQRGTRAAAELRTYPRLASLTLHRLLARRDFHRTETGQKRLNRVYLKPTQLYALVFGVIHVGLGITGLLMAPGLESHALLTFGFP
jgi:hypothetical protein